MKQRERGSVFSNSTVAGGLGPPFVWRDNAQLLPSTRTAGVAWICTAIWAVARDNHIADNPGNGIEIWNDRNIVERHTLVDNGRGIYTINSADYNIIHSNTAMGNSSAQYDLAPASAMTWDS